MECVGLIIRCKGDGICGTNILPFKEEDIYETYYKVYIRSNTNTLFISVSLIIKCIIYKTIHTSVYIHKFIKLIGSIQNTRVFTSNS